MREEHGMQGSFYAQSGVGYVSLTDPDGKKHPKAGIATEYGHNTIKLGSIGMSISGVSISFSGKVVSMDKDYKVVS